jgi:benzodiazapine receptor
MPWSTEKKWAAVAAAGVPLAVSTASGLIFRPGCWFRSLKKSCLMPPGWVFGVVWTILYILLGVSMIIACYDSSDDWTWALPIINIVISLMFAPIMFGLHWLAGSAAITTLCLFLGLGVIIQFATVNNSTLAAGLMIPYVAWLFLATYLAWSTWKLNC